MIKRNRTKFDKIVDKTVRISDEAENGVLKMLASTDEHGKLVRYSFEAIVECFEREWRDLHEEIKEKVEKRLMLRRPLLGSFLRG